MLSLQRSVALVSAALLSAVVLAGCASRTVVPGDEVAVLPPGDAVAEAVGRPEYRLGPSDLLTVTVFQVEDLEREVRINNAGQILLPLIGLVDAAGKTETELALEIAQRYAADWLQNPQVTVFVQEYASRRVTVGGAVEKPGIFPIDSQLTLIQALALAEGFNEVADLENVLVFRTVGGQRMFARFDVKMIQNGELDDPVLEGEDIVVVDTSGGKVFLQNLIKITPLVAVWRYYK